MTAIRLALLLTTLVLFALLPGESLAQDASSCSDDLGVAENAYFNGDFERTIELLQPCVNQNAFAANDAQRAIILLGRTHFVLGEEDAAHSAIESLFALNPSYEPDPQIPPNFAAFINQVKQDLLAAEAFPSVDPLEEFAETETPADTAQVALGEDEELQARQVRRRKNLFLFGGGAAIAVAGVTAALLSGGSPDEPPIDEGFPLPPRRP